VIERHIMKNIPGGHNLFVQDQGVSKLIENVYSKVIARVLRPVLKKWELRRGSKFRVQPDLSLVVQLLKKNSSCAFILA
jgi:hypothetical protein